MCSDGGDEVAQPRACTLARGRYADCLLCDSFLAKLSKMICRGDAGGIAVPENEIRRRGGARICGCRSKGAAGPVRTSIAFRFPGLSIAQDRRPSLQFSLKVCPAELFAIERTSRGARDVIDAMTSRQTSRHFRRSAQECSAQERSFSHRQESATRAAARDSDDDGDHRELLTL